MLGFDHLCCCTWNRVRLKTNKSTPCEHIKKNSHNNHTSAMQHAVVHNSCGHLKDGRQQNKHSEGKCFSSLSYHILNADLIDSLLCINRILIKTRIYVCGWLRRRSVCFSWKAVFEKGTKKIVFKLFQKSIWVWKRVKKSLWSKVFVSKAGNNEQLASIESEKLSFKIVFFDFKKSSKVEWTVIHLSFPFFPTSNQRAYV